MKRRAILVAEAALCAAAAAWLAVSAVGVYLDGAAARAADPLAAIYTREIAARRLGPFFAVLPLILALAAVGLALGARGKARDGKPVAPKGGYAPEPAGRGVAAALAILALALVVAGILNGSARDVLTKAANICTECVGLG